MNTIKKILIPVDFSESSLAAIKYVAGMSKNDSSVKCDLIYIAPKGTSDEEKATIKGKLEELKTQYFNPVQISSDVYIKFGELNNILLTVKEKLEVDLIIMGTAGATDEDRESRTVKLLEVADCPVLVIPQSIDQFELKNIALALDHKQIDDSSSLGVLHDIARWYDAKIHLLTVDRENGKAQGAIGKNADTLEYYLDTLDYHHSFAKNSDIELGLRSYVDEKNIDILAIMPRNHAKNMEPSEGRLTKILALHSTKPLLVID
ncbi:MAG: universal stress protein [Cyclobacteriaceae bacterium]